MRLSRSTDSHRPPARPRAPLPKGRPRARAKAEPSAPLADERRMRESGGPDDNATYGCACGCVFEAPVSTSVACPLCGAGQAW